MGDIFGVLLTFVLLAANAFFVGSEFALISARRDRLEALGSHYGALPAHEGMWRAAEDTAGALLARLATRHHQPGHRHAAPARDPTSARRQFLNRAIEMTR